MKKIINYIKNLSVIQVILYIIIISIDIYILGSVDLIKFRMFLFIIVNVILNELIKCMNKK